MIRLNASRTFKKKSLFKKEGNISMKSLSNPRKVKIWGEKIVSTTENKRYITLMITIEPKFFHSFFKLFLPKCTVHAIA